MFKMQERVDAVKAAFEKNEKDGKKTYVWISAYELLGNGELQLILRAKCKFFGLSSDRAYFHFPNTEHHRPNSIKLATIGHVTSRSHGERVLSPVDPDAKLERNMDIIETIALWHPA